MLPDLFLIEISSAKITDYLLNPHHPEGWSKASFFLKHGFDTEEKVKRVLFGIVQQNEIKAVTTTAFGTKYIVDGSIMPGDNNRLRTVWIVLKGEKNCKFVTAYPI